MAYNVGNPKICTGIVFAQRGHCVTKYFPIKVPFHCWPLQWWQHQNTESNKEWCNSSSQSASFRICPLEQGRCNWQETTGHHYWKGLLMWRGLWKIDVTSVVANADLYLCQWSTAIQTLMVMQSLNCKSMQPLLLHIIWPEMLVCGVCGNSFWMPSNSGLILSKSPLLLQVYASSFAPSWTHFPP